MQSLRARRTLTCEIISTPWPSALLLLKLLPRNPRFGSTARHLLPAHRNAEGVSGDVPSVSPRTAESAGFASRETSGGQISRHLGSCNVKVARDAQLASESRRKGLDRIQKPLRWCAMRARSCRRCRGGQTMVRGVRGEDVGIDPDGEARYPTGARRLFTETATRDRLRTALRE